MSVSLIALVAVRGEAAAQTKTGATAPQFAAGDYTLRVDVTKGVKKPTSVNGSLSLRRLTSAFDDGLGHPYYGWTDVDFRSLGAAMDATAVPPNSRDPENPGVLAVSIPPGMGGLAKFLGVPAEGVVMLLVGTVSNRKQTRMQQDGGGIALLAQASKGGCIVGEWVSHGVAQGAEGAFRLCPKAAAK